MKSDLQSHNYIDWWNYTNRIILLVVPQSNPAAAIVPQFSWDIIKHRSDINGSFELLGHMLLFYY